MFLVTPNFIHEHLHRTDGSDLLSTLRFYGQVTRIEDAEIEVQDLLHRNVSVAVHLDMPGIELEADATELGIVVEVLAQWRGEIELEAVSITCPDPALLGRPERVGAFIEQRAIDILEIDRQTRY